MRPIDESYSRIAKAVRRKEPPLVIAKLGDDWRVSYNESHAQAGTLELAAYMLANRIETRKQ